METNSLNIIGYKNKQVPNTFIIQPTSSRHLGIILPGYRYPADMPVLHYAGGILLEQGADLLRVEYTYYQTDFKEQPESEQEQWISRDVIAACNAALSQRCLRSDHPGRKIAWNESDGASPGGCSLSRRNLRVVNTHIIP